MVSTVSSQICTARTVYIVNNALAVLVLQLLPYPLYKIACFTAGPFGYQVMILGCAFKSANYYAKAVRVHYYHHHYSIHITT